VPTDTAHPEDGTVRQVIQNREEQERWWSAGVNSAYAAAFRGLSTVLVDRPTRAATALDHLPLRVTDLAGVATTDDVVVLCGPNAGRRVALLAARLGAGMPRVVAIAPDLRHGDVCLALTHGVTSYLVESEPTPFLGSCLAEVIARTAAGMSCLTPAAATVLLDRARSVPRRPAAVTHTGTTAPDHGIEALTARETQILRAIADGSSVTEAAERLSLSRQTVRNNLSRIYAKLRVRRQPEAVLAWLGYVHRDTGSTR
jgi:DNA-binding NarL/FixJ family response regulator